ncbi:hypothetical protein F4678DRAFT_439506 [Xylaria arbuscula]|nr:hypothetical protein F4678DRAFT_439506 [Xylaria arbuscula]
MGPDSSGPIKMEPTTGQTDPLSQDRQLCLGALRSCQKAASLEPGMRCRLCAGSVSQVEENRASLRSRTKQRSVQAGIIQLRDSDGFPFVICDYQQTGRGAHTYENKRLPLKEGRTRSRRIYIAIGWRGVLLRSSWAGRVARGVNGSCTVGRLQAGRCGGPTPYQLRSGTQPRRGAGKLLRFSVGRSRRSTRLSSCRSCARCALLDNCYV